MKGNRSFQETIARIRQKLRSSRKRCIGVLLILLGIVLGIVSRAAGGSPSQDFTTVLWDFGDGSTSTKLTEAHYFANPGTYTVKLTVYNDVGSDTVTYDVTVGEDPGDDEFPWTLMVAAVLIAVVILALIIRYLL